MMTQSKIEFDCDSRSSEIQVEWVIQQSRTNLNTSSLSINVDDQTKKSKVTGNFLKFETLNKLCNEKKSIKL
jgi:hypothetical protein